MDSLHKKPQKKYLPPLPEESFSSPALRKAKSSFSHSFSLPPKKISRTTTQESSHKKRHPRKPFRVKKFFITLFAFFFLVIVVGVFFLFWRSSQVSQTAFIKDHSGNILTETAKQLMGQKKTREPLQGEEDGRVNILLLGKAGKDYPGQNLTDTIIVASIDTKERKTALISLPRDFYAKIPDTNTSTKLNAFYFYGKNENDPFRVIRSAVSEITGLPIHYAIALDYDGFIKTIDALGGINVTVERDFYDPSYPGPNYSFEPFELKKGFHTLNGTIALKYVRERHDDPQGDFGRSARQQQVIQAIKNKAFTIKTFLNPFTVYDLLGAIESNIKTDFSLKEIESFLTLIQDVDTQNINTLVVDAWRKDSLLRVSHIVLDSGQQMFTLVPRTGTYQEIQESSKNIFSNTDTQIRTRKIVEEKAKILLINTTKKPQLATNVSELLSDLGFENVEVVSTPDATELARTYVRKLSENTKAFSLDEIIKKIPATLSGESLDDFMPKKISPDTDFALVLGNDILPNYLWEKGTVEEYLKGTGE